MYVNPKHPDYARLTGRRDRPDAESAPAPQDAGQRLATFDRTRRGCDSAEEVRVELAEFNGNPFVSLRTWFRSPHDGVFYPTKKGLSIRVPELDDAIEALRTARRLAGARRADAPARGRRAGTQARPSGPTRDVGTAAGGFDQFDEAG